MAQMKQMDGKTRHEFRAGTPDECLEEKSAHAARVVGVGAIYDFFKGHCRADYNADMQDFLAFTAFAIAGAFTPGPNNTIAIATGVRFGPWRVWPHALGTMLGFSSMLVLASAGALAALLAIPGAEPVLRIAGVGYLLWIAWRIARSDGPQDRSLARPLTLIESALIQFISPKGWMLALSVAGAWFSGLSGQPGLIAGYILWFALLCAASIAVWSGAGGLLRGWLRDPKHLQWFNLAMGGLLAASALSLLVT